ncbi:MULTISPECIES: transcription antitermination factor NusB [Sellimonas]|uniref:Transcription antitermination protein NusB n=1 Tax=Sellimonas caecigallum TaxID=2592333 RepID=A0ABS7L6N2_9FIRM|nr:MULTISPECIES: transcription antitermination factor NusB [Sellimonas]MBY0758587.1 transcription antitermination factor NusB [Sellimonas caecigallum]OUP03312.1 transcription antitermination factor NusB [Drancourtella sp. An210]OUP64813.1 transcription antitermination factor NusB [Drancourtella sp. An177]
MGRSEIREHIFRVLFRKEFFDTSEMSGQRELYMEMLKAERDVREEDEAYILEKSRKIEEKIQEIDEMINGLTTGWKTSRMNKADLTILRLAVYEIKWDDDIPVKVAINEAVELAKKYSSEEGPAFINGVLAKIAG